MSPIIDCRCLETRRREPVRAPETKRKKKEMMANLNENQSSAGYYSSFRKQEILMALASSRELYSSTLASQLGLTHSNTSELLRRYCRSGEVSRHLVSKFPRRFLYSLTLKGYQRL